MKRLYFIRHGLSEANKLGVFGGRGDHALSAEGKKQAKTAGQMAKNLKIDLIVSSTQSRAKHTAEIIAGVIGYPTEKIVTNKLIVERDFGALEGKPWTDPRKLDLNTIAGLESDEALLKRAEEAYEWLKEQIADNILVVSHGAFGRALRKIVLPKHDYHERIMNAEVVCWVEDD